MLAEELGAGRRPPAVGGAGQGGLEPVAGGGQGGHQLLRRVGHEAALAHGRGLEPVEHGVHRLGQPVDLVAGARLRHPPVELPGRDVGHFGPDRLHRAQRPADGQPGRQRHQAQQRRQAEEHQPAEDGDVVLHPVETGGDVHDRGVGRARPPQGQQPVLVVGADAAVELLHGVGAEPARLRPQRRDGAGGGAPERGGQHPAVAADHLDDLAVLRGETLGQLTAVGQAGDVDRPHLGHLVDVADQRAAQQRPGRRGAEDEGDAEGQRGPQGGSGPDGGEQPHARSLSGAQPPSAPRR